VIKASTCQGANCSEAGRRGSSFTLRELEALSEKHDFNAFPVLEHGSVLGSVTKFYFLKVFAFTTSRWCRTMTS
jgi:CBS-domain-containing membrane protein